MKVIIKNNEFNVKICMTSESIRNGMMGKRFDSDYQGLLFMMGGEEQCFWMKNCIIPLDIIMVKDYVIVNIHHNCPPCNDIYCPNYCGKGNIVLELEGGTCERLGIEPGDLLEYVV